MTDEELVAYIYEQESLRDEYDERAKAARAELRTRVKPGEQFDIGDYHVVATSNNRFNARKAEALVPEEQRPLVMSQQLDRKKFEALFADLVPLALDENATRISIKMKED